MKKIIFIILSTIVIIAVGCNNKKEPTKIQLKTELPPAKVCKSNIGILKMDPNGYTIGKTTERTELKKLLNNKDCDIIEITYILKMTYGDNIPKKIVYNKLEKSLKDIFTSTNVIENYKNVDSIGLAKFLRKGVNNFYSLSKYTNSKYDFNNREMKQTAMGKKPEQSEWDGSVKVVKNYLKSVAKDASSLEFIEWSKITASGNNWVVRCKYKGTNSLGAIITENKWFYIQNKKVVSTK